MARRWGSTIVAVATLLLTLAAFALGRPFFFDHSIYAEDWPAAAEPPPTTSCEPGPDQRVCWVLRADRERDQQMLFEMGEPFLTCCNPGVDEVYRFTWVRSFRPAVVVRFWRQDETRYVSVTTKDGRHLSFRPVRTILIAEWTAVRNAVDQSGFWRENETDSDIGPDGATWTLEARRGPLHRVVDRFSPQGGPFREACLTLLHVAGFDVPPQEVY